MTVEPVLIAAIASFWVGFLFGRGTAPRSGVRRDSALVTTLEALPEDLEARVRMLVGSGKKIEAIKEVRRITNCGLKQAKDLVEAMTHSEGVE